MVTIFIGTLVKVTLVNLRARFVTLLGSSLLSLIIFIMSTSTLDLDVFFLLVVFSALDFYPVLSLISVLLGNWLRIGDFFSGVTINSVTVNIVFLSSVTINQGDFCWGANNHNPLFNELWHY